MTPRLDLLALELEPGTGMAGEAPDLARIPRTLLAALEAVPDPVLVIDRDHRVQPLNRAARSLTRRFVGRGPPRCHELLHGREQPCHECQSRCPLRQVLATGQALLVEHTHRGPNGEARTVEIWAAPVSLGDRVAAVAQTLRDVTATRLREQKLLEREQRARHLATIDSLTGVLNRAAFFFRLEHALAAMERTGYRSAVGFLDLDGFKSINDRLGHETGDLVLRAVAGRLLAALRRSDSVGRLGGDEFAFLLEPVRNREAALGVAEEIASRISAPIALAGELVAVGASVGLALCPDDARAASNLLRLADRAMYESKRRGGARVFACGSTSSGSLH